MTDEPLISIVVPCYNHAQYLEASLCSIFLQDYKNIEVVVVDDGSTDESSLVINRLQKKYGFTTIVQDNRGVTAAVSRGYEVACGEFFMSFDADDIMLPGRLSRQVAFMRQHPQVGCCGANFIYIDSEGAEFEGAPRKKAAFYTFKELFETDGLWVGGPTSLYRIEAIRKAGGYDLSLDIQDLQMELKVAHAGYKIAILEDVVTLYRRHNHNISSNYKRNVDICLRTVQVYSAEPGYLKAKRSIINGALKRAVTEDKAFARHLFSLLPLRAWDLKTFSRFRRYLFR